MQGKAETDFPGVSRSTFDFQKLTARAFYWLPVRRLAILKRFEERIRSAEACAVLDLEDGLWFPEDPVKTDTGRAAARGELLQGAALLRRLTGGMALGIRVNPIATPDFGRDLECLSATRVDWDFVFLPKVESGADCRRASAALSYFGIPHRELIPIVETREGARRIKDIAGAARGTGASWIQYGHQDYSLSSGHWPFWEQDSWLFRAHVEALVAEAEAHGLGYIHTPYMHLRDLEGFLDVQGWLNRICKRPHSQATLSMEQTLACRDGAPEEMPLWKDGPAQSPAEAARRVVEGYRMHSHTGRGFSVDAGTGRFFSPQEYLAASRYLARNPDERA